MCGSHCYIFVKTLIQFWTKFNNDFTISIYVSNDSIKVLVSNEFVNSMLV